MPDSPRKKCTNTFLRTENTFLTYSFSRIFLSRGFCNPTASLGSPYPFRCFGLANISNFFWHHFDALPRKAQDLMILSDLASRKKKQIYIFFKRKYGKNSSNPLSSEAGVNYIPSVVAVSTFSSSQTSLPKYRHRNVAAPALSVRLSAERMPTF